MREDLAPFPDAEKVVIDYLSPLLEDYSATPVGIGVRGGGGRFVRVRRVGGIELSPNHDAPSIDVLVWHDSDAHRMALAQYLWTAMRAADGDLVDGAVLMFSATILGPRQMPDPADDNATVCLFTVEVLLRNA